MTAPIFILLVFLALVTAWAAFPRLRAGQFKSRSWMMLRALFPSWRFFEELAWVPQLWFRVLDQDDGIWMECIPNEVRSVGILFLNGRGNLRMAAHSLIEQFAAEVGDLADGEEASIASSVSYELIIRLVRYHLRERSLTKPGLRFQFKIVAAIPGKNEKTAGEDIMISAVHEV